MIGWLWIAATLLTWASLYQGILILGSWPPTDAELSKVSGIVRHVDAPLTRNRHVPTVELHIETALVRTMRLTVRTVSMPLASAQALQGHTITVQFASGRPRNRWIYDLRAGDRHLVRLEHERGRDQEARSAACYWMLALGAIALAILNHIRRRKTSGCKHE
jgi:hypothetical protein